MLRPIKIRSISTWLYFTRKCTACCHCNTRAILPVPHDYAECNEGQWVHDRLLPMPWIWNNKFASSRYLRIHQRRSDTIPEKTFSIESSVVTVFLQPVHRLVFVHCNHRKTKLSLTTVTSINQPINEDWSIDVKDVDFIDEKRSSTKKSKYSIENAVDTN